MEKAVKVSERAEKIFYYHERTKHLPHRYARSAGYMDWAKEPFPFRFFEGAPLIKLPLGKKDPEGVHIDLYDRDDSHTTPLSIESISKYLELSLGLSAWKAYGNNKWALRMNPSSGNLHPTEAHLILPSLPESKGKGTISHYNPLLHALEVRSSFDESIWAEISREMKEEGFFLALTSIYWRESWKYGERAFRYCNLDIGHALAALSFSANLLGWSASIINTLSNKEIERLFGFHKTPWKKFEREQSELLIYIHKEEINQKRLDICTDCIDSFSRLSYCGEPNLLSKEHEDWHIIDEAAIMTEKERTKEKDINYINVPYLMTGQNKVEATPIIRQRRSAQHYDGKTFIDMNDFFALLDKTIPRTGKAPFNRGEGEINTHLFIFVHRVKGIEEGLYFLYRGEDKEGEIKEILSPDFLWEKGDKIPIQLPLFLLKKGNFREEAAMLSCGQAIAGDSAFSLGMLARFRETVEKDPASYRRLFRECGIIGQVLYLEAEFIGLRGTGIGCYYDDLVHRLLGIKDNTYQSLYHFTVGGPLEDKRLTTLPPYHHIDENREKIKGNWFK